MSPTYYEIADELSLNAASTAYGHCRHLKDKGLIAIQKVTPQGLSLTRLGESEYARLKERPSFEIKADRDDYRIRMTGGEMALEQTTPSSWVLRVVPAVGAALTLSLTGAHGAPVLARLREE